MEQISSLLIKFKNLTEKSESVKKTIIETLNDRFNLKIKNSDAVISGKKLSLKIIGVKKTEVLTQKNRIIKEINNALGGDAISDISF